MRVVPQHAAIIGGGPAGLLSAIMLAQRGWERISVYDSRTEPPKPDDALWGTGERSYQLGLNGRGQTALRKLGALETVEAFSASVNGRLSLKAGEQPEESRLKPPALRRREDLRRGSSSATAAVVPAARGRQVSQIGVEFGVACEGVYLEGDQPAVRFCAPAADEEGCELDGLIEDDRVQSYDLVVGADGVRSAVRESLSLYGNTRTVRFEDKNERRYKTLPLHPSAVAGTASDLNWGCRNASIDLGMDALPTMEGEMVAVLLVKPDTPVYKTIEGLSSGADARAFFEESLPAIIPYVRDDDLERFVTRPISRLPPSRSSRATSTRRSTAAASCPRHSIKAVKPYFGQGANSALEDVTILADCLEECGDEPAAAAAAFTAARRRRAWCARRGASTAAARSAATSSCLCSSTCSSTSSRRSSSRRRRCAACGTGATRSPGCRSGSAPSARCSSRSSPRSWCRAAGGLRLTMNLVFSEPLLQLRHRDASPRAGRL